MYVKNVTGSSRFSKPSSTYGDSWLNYWERQTNKTLYSNIYYKCPVCGNAHLRNNFDGAHVQKAFGSDNRWYIVPMCSSCNHKKGIFYITAPLVPCPSNL